MRGSLTALLGAVLSAVALTCFAWLAVQGVEAAAALQAEGLCRRIVEATGTSGGCIVLDVGGCTVRLQEGKVVVEHLGGSVERAASGKTLLPSAGSGVVAVYWNETHAWIGRPGAQGRTGGLEPPQVYLVVDGAKVKSKGFSGDCAGSLTLVNEGGGCTVRFEVVELDAPQHRAALNLTLTLNGVEQVRVVEGKLRVNGVSQEVPAGASLPLAYRFRGVKATAVKINVFQLGQLVDQLTLTYSWARTRIAFPLIYLPGYYTPSRSSYAFSYDFSDELREWYVDKLELAVSITGGSYKLVDDVELSGAWWSPWPPQRDTPLIYTNLNSFSWVLSEWPMHPLRPSLTRYFEENPKGTIWWGNRASSGLGSLDVSAWWYGWFPFPCRQLAVNGLEDAVQLSAWNPEAEEAGVIIEVYDLSGARLASRDAGFALPPGGSASYKLIPLNVDLAVGETYRFKLIYRYAQMGNITVMDLPVMAYHGYLAG
ncbi:MAG: hypothetical protein QXW94_02190 [Desulfurococcaceae archaeon]